MSGGEAMVMFGEVVCIVTVTAAACALAWWLSMGGKWW